jgi:hypothetical protein
MSRPGKFRSANVFIPLEKHSDGASECNGFSPGSPFSIYDIRFTSVREGNGFSNWPDSGSPRPQRG